MTPEQAEIARLEQMLSQLKLGVERSQGLLAETGPNAPVGDERARIQHSLGQMQLGMDRTQGLLGELQPPAPAQAPAQAPQASAAPAMPQGLLGNPAAAGGGFQPSLPPEKLAQLYGIMAAGADDPTKIGTGYAQRMQQNDQLGIQAENNNLNKISIQGDPASVREWQFYNSLPEAQKKQYLEMKRGLDLQKIAGGLGTQYTFDQDMYSAPEAEYEARRREAEAKGLGAANATRYASLAEGANNRVSNYNEARRLRALLGAGDLNPGQYKQALHLIWRDADLEALDALAEQVARARLKANGETRMTDADVIGMKRTLFGAGRTEEFTARTLDMMIQEIERQEQEYRNLARQMRDPMYELRPEQGILGDDSDAPDYSALSADELIQRALGTQNGE